MRQVMEAERLFEQREKEAERGGLFQGLLGSPHRVTDTPGPYFSCVLLML